METKKEIREFLTSRRARITPEQAGLPTYGARRVPGLRREEVAVLAGVSVPYYTRLERGDMSGASEGVLEALARALQLDDAERAHLFDLARAAQPAGARPRRRQAKPRIRPEIQWTLDAITGAAAYVGNDRLDILATNELGRALFSELYAAPARPANHARFVFLDPRAEAFYADWDRAARETAAILRSAAGRDPYDRDLSDLVGELATQSEAFRTHWAAHNVRFHATAVKHFHHPVVGELSLSFNRLDVAADHGLTLFTYAAEPGSRSEEALNLLGSWAATVDLAESARTTDHSSTRVVTSPARRLKTWSSGGLRERRVVDQRAQLARGGVVEGQERRPDRPGRVADEAAGGLDGGRVALALQELAQRPEAGPQLARGGEVDVVDQEPVQLDALLGDDRGGAPDDGADAGGERGEGERVPAVEQRRAVALDQLGGGDGVATGVLEAGDRELARAARR